MPGFHVHAFMTAATYDTGKRIMPAGVNPAMPSAGTLLFMSDASQMVANYDVYHSTSSIAMGPLSQSYEFLGNVNERYGHLLPPPPPADIPARGYDPRTDAIRGLCGWTSPIHEFYAMASHGGGLDLYVYTLGEKPADVFRHYWIDIHDPIDWWRARDYHFQGAVHVPEWAPAPMRSRL